MNQLGKRYTCEVCGSLVLCAMPGSGTLVCCDREMHQMEARALPSSD
jgi:desulfoferrodoxin-like iron-binding protein